MISTGVALAIFWHYADIPHWPAWNTLGISSARSAGHQDSEDRLARIVSDLETLRKSIGDLGASQQQVMASMATLQAGQQDLRQRLAAAQTGPHWYSDPAALRLRFAIAQKNAPVAAAPRMATAENVARRHDGGPLELAAPRP